MAGRQRERRHSDANWRENGRAGRTKNAHNGKQSGWSTRPAPTTISIHMDKLIQDVGLYTYIRITMRKASLLQWDVDSIGNVAWCRARVFRTAARTKIAIFGDVRMRTSSNLESNRFKFFWVPNYLPNRRLKFLSLYYNFVLFFFFRRKIDNIHPSNHSKCRIIVVVPFTKFQRRGNFLNWDKCVEWPSSCIY